MAMNNKKKLYFLGFKWRQFSWWTRSLIVIFILLLDVLMRYLIDDRNIRAIAGILLFGSFYGYLIFEWTRKNAIYYRRNDGITIKIAGKKLHIDTNFISKAWLDEDGLNIQRINRVDTFPVDHLKEQDVERLLQILKEYET